MSVPPPPPPGFLNVPRSPGGTMPTFGSYKRGGKGVSSLACGSLSQNNCYSNSNCAWNDALKTCRPTWRAQEEAEEGAWMRKTFQPESTY